MAQPAYVAPPPGLSTTYINPTATTLSYPFLGMHGVKLAPGATVTLAGDPYTHIRYNGDQDRKALALALKSGVLAIVATPSPVLQDTVTGVVDQVGLTSGSLTVVAPGWIAAPAFTPSVIKTTPAASATAVAVNATIVVTFDEPVTGTTFAVTQNGSSVSGSAAGSVSNTVWTFTPGSNLPADSVVVATITGATNSSGNAAPSYTLTFYVTPTMTIVPANAATGVAASTTVAATFSAAVTGVSISLKQGSPTLTIAGSLVGSSGNTVWTFTPTANINTGKTFTVVVSGATDANGSVMANSTTTFST